MSGLEQAFYIISIIYMGVMFIIIIALVVAVFMIKNKINHIQRSIEERINLVTNIAEKSGEIAGAAAARVARGAKSAIKKAKK
jgi:hypothetical protein